jgi:hypothetical protein
MATKFKTPEAPEGFVDTTKAEPIPVVMDGSPAAPTPDPEPARASAVLVGHRTLSDDEVRRVNQTKQHFDAAIIYLLILRDSYHDAEAQRMFSVAITNAETASMWAVRGITHRG